MTFSRKQVRLTFQLGPDAGTFEGTGKDTATVSGARVNAQLHQVSGPGMGTAEVRVFGLTMSLMNRLSTLNTAAMVAQKNTLIVEAGDGETMAVVFIGQIILGQIELNTAPDSSLLIVAQAGADSMGKLIPPTSYPGTADAAVILANLAKQANLAFEANGASVQLSTPYYWGSARDQIAKCAEAAGLDWMIEGGTLVVRPRGGYRKGAVPIVSPSTGLVGYPNYSTSILGVRAKTEFNPNLRVMALVAIQDSGLLVANGTWRVFNIEHALDSETPGGAWFSTFDCATLDS